jgi:hypothetical protein
MGHKDRPQPPQYPISNLHPPHPGWGAIIVSHKNFVSPPTPSTTDKPIPTLHSLSEGSLTGEGPIIASRKKGDRQHAPPQGCGSPITWNQEERMVEYQADPIRRRAP